MADVYVAVRVEGEDVTALLARLEVEESDQRCDLATLTFADPTLLLPDLLHEGLGVEIDLGRPDSHAVLFRGVITALRCHFPDRGPAKVVVEAGDPLIALGRQPRTKRWWNTTLGGIVREVALANGLQPGRIAPTPDPTFDETRPVQQVEETDLALLHRLAADYDCKVSATPNGALNRLDFQATADLLTADPVAPDLVYGGSLVTFTGQFDAFATDPAGRLVTTDPRTGVRTETDAQYVTATDAAWLPDAKRLAALGANGQWAAKLLAKGAPVRARLTEQWRTPGREAGAAAGATLVVGDHARLLGQTAHGEADGSIALQARRRVRVTGCGGRWSGPWYLATVRHEVDIDARRYTTCFVATR